MDVNPGEAGRALAVITTDHTNEESRALAKIVTELLEEDGFYVDGVVVVPNDEDEIHKRPAPPQIAQRTAGPQQCRGVPGR